MRSLPWLMVLFLMITPGCGEDDVKASDDTAFEADADADSLDDGGAASCERRFRKFWGKNNRIGGS